MSNNSNLNNRNNNKNNKLNLLRNNYSTQIIENKNNFNSKLLPFLYALNERISKVILFKYYNDDFELKENILNSNIFRKDDRFSFVKELDKLKKQTNGKYYLSEIDESYEKEKEYQKLLLNEIKIKLNFKKEYNESYEFINQLKNGYLICCKNNKIIIYYYNFQKVTEIYVENKKFKIYEINDNNILVITEEDILYLISTNEYNKYKRKDLKDLMKIKLILELDKNEYIISGSGGTFHFKGDILLLEKKDLKIKISDECYEIGRLIDEKKFVFISNKKEDKVGHLVIFDLNKKNEERIIYKIDNFSSSVKNCFVMELENEKMVLCDYKYSDRKEGLLLINLGNLRDNKSIISELFFEMKDSEHICLCPLKYFKESEYVINENENIKEIFTGYFLVNIKNKIFLYMIKKDESTGIMEIIEINEIEHKQTINNIICILQYKVNAEIIICWQNEKSKSFDLALDNNKKK